MDRDRILGEYREGDPDKRMSLFLYCRELREEFDTIEQESLLDLSSAPVQPQRGRIRPKIAASLRALSYYLRSRLLPNQARH